MGDEMLVCPKLTVQAESKMIESVFNFLTRLTIRSIFWRIYWSNQIFGESTDPIQFFGESTDPIQFFGESTDPIQIFFKCVDPRSIVFRQANRVEVNFLDSDWQQKRVAFDALAKI
jgi:hypothetical protein